MGLKPGFVRDALCELFLLSAPARMKVSQARTKCLAGSALFQRCRFTSAPSSVL